MRLPLERLRSLARQGRRRHSGLHDWRLTPLLKAPEFEIAVCELRHHVPWGWSLSLGADPFQTAGGGRHDTLCTPTKELVAWACGPIVGQGRGRSACERSNRDLCPACLQTQIKLNSLPSIHTDTHPASKHLIMLIYPSSKLETHPASKRGSSFYSWG